MRLSLKNNILSFMLLTGVFSNSSYSAEWITEPGFAIRTQYNDNVRAYVGNANPQASTGYTLVPNIKVLAKEESLWDMALDAKSKVTRYQDITNADSENIFFSFNGNYKTELTRWGLKTSFEKNSLFDTDFNTENIDSNPIGLDDRTERDTKSIFPSVQWNIGEASLLSLTINSTEVAYKKVTNLRFKDYNFDSVQLAANWAVSESQQLGFTTSLSKYNSQESGFSYNQTILQLDYTYSINQTSKMRISAGGRRLNSLLVDGKVVGCEADGEFEALGGCLFSPPIFADVNNQGDGTVIDVSYNKQSESASHSIKGGRTIQPSSFGGAQEILSANYQFVYNNTERFITKLLIDASDKTTVSGAISPYDRSRYRVEPSVVYKLNKNWNVTFLYRYISQKYAVSDENSVSNAVFLNLSLRWPKLVTTY